MLPSPRWIAEATTVDLAKPSATTKIAAQYTSVAKDGTVTPLQTPSLQAHE